MAQYKSPYAVAYRKPVYIYSTDPRAYTDQSLEQFTSRAGSPVVVQQVPPIQFQEGSSGDYVEPPEYSNMFSYAYFYGTSLFWTPTGYVRQIPVTAEWNFYFFSDYYDDSGNNIRVDGRLTSQVFTPNTNSTVEFYVYGQIESVDGPNYDILKLIAILEDGSSPTLATFNPTVDINGTALQPYDIPERKESISLASYAGQKITLQFVWDTMDQNYQKFNGWYVRSLEILG